MSPLPVQVWGVARLGLAVLLTCAALWAPFSLAAPGSGRTLDLQGLKVHSTATVLSLQSQGPAVCP